MKPSVVLRAAVIAALSAALLWAGDPWNKKPYTEWNYDDVYSILQDSPWTKSVAIVGGAIQGGPVPGGTGKIEHVPSQAMAGSEVIVRWFSALTVREAFYRGNELRRTVSDDRAGQLLSWQPQHYVIQVDPANALGDSFLDSVDRPLDDEQTAASLEIARTGEKIAPIKRQALGLTQLYSFPRQVNGQPLLGPEDSKVRFRYEAGKSRKTVTFDLRKMTRNGQPDL